MLFVTVGKSWIHRGLQIKDGSADCLSPTGHADQILTPMLITENGPIHTAS
jgi:hypothetical protein